MGFPTWTLWGMGLSAIGALLAIALAFLAQSPRMLTRLKLNNQRLDLRARTFTGYGLALLLLALGFFVAGVPLDQGNAAETVADNGAALEQPAGTLSASATLTETVPLGGNSGAMVGLPTSPSGGEDEVALGTPEPSLTGTLPLSGTADLSLPPGAVTGEPASDATQDADSTSAPTVTPTLFPTATSTPTPAPTMTPTPILGPTARVGDSTSTLPVRRLPGGPVLVVLVRGDTLLPLSGHAFHTGDIWREISTVDGVIGWVPEEFLEYGEE